MSGYVTVNRLSLVQLHSEERQQRAHFRKIAETQRRSGVENNKPPQFPHLKQSFVNQLSEKRKEIARENDAKSKRLIDIMATKTVYPPLPFHPSNQPTRQNQSLRLSQNNADYVERISKTKGIYDVREWRKGYDEHKEHLKISKDNKLFTPRDVGINRQRITTTSTMNSRRTTLRSSVTNIPQQFDKND